MEARASGECTGCCEWERQPQAFRWFLELGVPLHPSSRWSPDPAAAELPQPDRAVMSG